MAASSSEQRTLSEEIIRKTSEMQAIMERMTAVRFDHTRDVQDISRMIKNLTTELRRLDAELNTLKTKQLAAVEAALQLQVIGLPAHLLTSPTSGIAGARTSLDMDDTLTEEEMANLKLMRTASTGTLEGKPAKQKWHSLFKMFQEWKRETSIAQGQYALGGGAGRHLEDEINTVRAAIVSLQNKKQLPPSEQELMANLQQRLQQLLKAQQILANA